MAIRKDLLRMQNNIKRVKNPFGPAALGEDEKLKPVPDNRNLLEKGLDYITGGDSRTKMDIEGKTVEYTDSKGNAYDKDKNRIIK
tara:strand:- start:165 stop:419 length:255 start_codon:yes stop_codon:yes gene_type:complete